MDFLSGQRVLITGGTGMLGRHLCRYGINAGLEVHHLSRHETPISGAVHHSADMRDGEALKRIMGEIQPDGVIHAAAGGVAYGSGSFADLMNVNTVGLHNLLSALPESVRAVVIAGSGFEYAQSDQPLRESDPLRPTSPYGISKAAGWMVANTFARRFSIRWLRLFSLYGVGEKSPRLAPYIIDEARHGRPIELTAGEQVRDYLVTEDAAEAFYRALALDIEAGKMLTLNIGSGERITLRAFIDMLAEALRARGINPDLRFGAKPYRPDEPMFYAPNLDAMIGAFGWKPSTTYRDGLARMVEQHLEQA